MPDADMNKVTQYRLGCIQMCNKYVNLVKELDAESSVKCPKIPHPYEGMEIYDGRQEIELFCDNVIECAKCRERHYEGMKDYLLSQYSIRRTWRDRD